MFCLQSERCPKRATNLAFILPASDDKALEFPRNINLKKKNEGAATRLEQAAVRLQERLLCELERTEDCDDFRDANCEQRIRILTGIFKTLQGVDEMVNRIRQNGASRAKKGVDVVEFRRQLEEQIARIVEQEETVEFLDHLASDTVVTLHLWKAPVSASNIVDQF